MGGIEWVIPDFTGEGVRAPTGTVPAAAITEGRLFLPVDTGRFRQETGRDRFVLNCFRRRSSFYCIGKAIECIKGYMSQDSH